MIMINWKTGLSSVLIVALSLSLPQCRADEVKNQPTRNSATLNLVGAGQNTGQFNQQLTPIRVNQMGGRFQSQGGAVQFVPFRQFMEVKAKSPDRQKQALVSGIPQVLKVVDSPSQNVVVNQTSIADATSAEPTEIKVGLKPENSVPMVVEESVKEDEKGVSEPGDNTTTGSSGARTGQSEFDQVVQKATDLVNSVPTNMKDAIGGDVSSITGGLMNNDNQSPKKFDAPIVGELLKPANEPSKFGPLDNIIKGFQTAGDHVDTMMANNFGILRPTNQVGQSESQGFLEMIKPENIMNGAKKMIPNVNFMSKIPGFPSSSLSGTSRRAGKSGLLNSNISSNSAAISKYKAKLSLSKSLLEIIELTARLGLDGNPIDDVELNKVVEQIKQILGDYSVKNLGIKMGRAISG